MLKLLEQFWAEVNMSGRLQKGLTAAVQLIVLCFGWSLVLHLRHTLSLGRINPNKEVVLEFTESMLRG